MKVFVFIIIFYGFLVNVFAQNNQINEQNIPTTLNECYIASNNLLNDEIKQDIKLSSVNDLIKYHMNLGMWIRNNWIRLGSIGALFLQNDPRHMDDISQAIIISYHYYLNRIEKTVEELLDVKITCDFTEDIIMCLIDNLDEIENKIYYEDIGHEYKRFWNTEYNFFEYLRENIITNVKFNENIFIEKYNNLITSIPAELNTIFSEYPVLKENGYKHHINFIIYLHIIIYENIYNGNIDRKKLTLQNYNEINIKNINKIKSMFDRNDIDIIYKKTELIIEYFK